MRFKECDAIWWNNFLFFFLIYLFFIFLVEASSSFWIEDGNFALAASTFGCEDGIFTSISSSFDSEDNCWVESLSAVNLFWHQLESLIIFMEIISKEPGIPDWSSVYLCTVNGSFYFLDTRISSCSSVRLYELLQLVTVLDLCILISTIYTDDVLQLIVLLFFF